MDMISCNICGIVVDKHKLPFTKDDAPPDHYQLGQHWVYGKGLGRMVKIAPCPCCKWAIQQEGEG